MRPALPPILALLAVAVVPAIAAAQAEVPGSTGLGRPVPPLDARARALGGAAAALHGANLSAVNPAALIQLGGPGFWATVVPERRSVEGDGVDGVIRTSDFALARLAGLVSDRWAVSLTLGGFLSQDFGVQLVDTLQLSTGPVLFEETRSSDGGISQFRLDLAGKVSGAWTLGAAGIFYSGEVRKQVDRAFEAGAGFRPYRSAAAIQYRGWGVALGTQIEPIPEIILGVVGTWGPDGLSVENDSTGEELDVDLPITVDAGASLQLTSAFLVALSFGWAGWAALSDELGDRGSADTWGFGGGLEARLVGGLNSGLFFRAGAHWQRLPFEIRGGTPSERALSAGLGALLQGGRARLDATVELGRRASRDTNGVEESFTRLTLSLAIFGR